MTTTTSARSSCPSSAASCANGAVPDDVTTNGERTTTTTTTTTSDEGSSSSSSFRLGYVTDVEGNLNYFRSFVERSNVLDLVVEKRSDDDDDDDDDLSRALSFRLSLRDGCHFVYGGDVVDKGPGDIRLTRALVDLKERHPDRVFLLVGNRDLNKLRLSAELSEADMERDVDDIPPPFWDDSAPSLREYLERLISKSTTTNTNTTLHDVNTRANRLRYLLEHTLGCPDTFEFRREELALLVDEKDVASVSDERVVRSFLDEVGRPDGSLRRYLEVADAAVRVGHTLFVHGAVDARTVGFVPRVDARFGLADTAPPPDRICDNVDDWIARLRAFLRAGLDDHRRRPFWDGNRATRGGESLVALQNRASMWGRSVVSASYGDGGVVTHDAATAATRRALSEGGGDPRVHEGLASDPRDPVATAWLQRNGIRRVVVGHRPTGDCPAVLSTAAADADVEIVSADTSYSDTSARDRRGAAVSVVELVGRHDRDDRTVVFGTLRDGEEHRSAFPRLYGTDGADATTDDEDDASAALLGTELKDGWWVKACLVRRTDGGARRYRLCRGVGRHVEYDTANELDVLRRGKRKKRKLAESGQ